MATHFIYCTALFVTSLPITQLFTLLQVTRIGTFQVLEQIPHDTNAFTQGFFYYNHTLYESNGLYGKSNLRRVDASTGATLRERTLGAQYFAEGMCVYTANATTQLIQLTWKERTGFLYDVNTLERTGQFRYSTTTGEGWGITYDAAEQELYVTDGSEYLHVWDADTLEQTSKRAVTMQRQNMAEPTAVQMLNELEWDKNSKTLLSNVWFQDVVIRIVPETGFVPVVYNLQSLFTDRPDSADVLNGIALTDVPDEVYVTGKWWPYMYRIRLIDPEGV